MILNLKVEKSLEINELKDLRKLHGFIQGGIKLNYSEISRELGVDRRTVKKYITGYEKPKERNKGSQIDEYYSKIIELLYPATDEKPKKIFSYKEHLYRYLIDRNIIKDVKLSTFKHWIKQNERINEYFRNSKNNIPSLRFETDLGVQAQVDWKEDVPFFDNKGKFHRINVLCVFLGFSRFRFYGVSLVKTQEVLFHFLDKAFESFGGVTKVLVTDNMKTVMDVARTEKYNGKVNTQFQSFANDYGFEVKPCIAYKPQTKGKVESPMKILDIITAYNGDLSYVELVEKINEINDNENKRYHQSYGKIPVLSLQEEKNYLVPLPKQSIRNHYILKTNTVKVNKSCLAQYKNNTYSVPVEYMNKTVSLQVFGEYLHIYHNNNLVTIHTVNKAKGVMNYTEEHYKQIAAMNLPKGMDIESFAKSNLEKIGARKNGYSA